ncbi:MAG: sodium:glutamate symporter, partial [Bacteroidales bacterium]|nr:sodium:glutamate symporter [Bacteroidales bacterium]
MMIEFDIYQTLAVAVVALLVGEYIKRNSTLMQRFCIPSPVIGGLLFSLLSLMGYLTGWFEVSFNGQIKELCMVFFFTSVGFQANMKNLRKGGRGLVLMIVLVVALILLQNLTAIGVAMGLGIDKLAGMTTGSIPMLGGHGTSGAFGPILEAMGVKGATTLATAAATFGLVAGSLIGGPIAERLIKNRDLLPTASNEEETVAVKNESPARSTSYMAAAFQLIIAVGLGTFVSAALQLTGLTFPIYIGSMIVAAIIRNIGESTSKINIPMEAIDDLGNIALSLFLGMAMISLRLWELAELALPLLVLLTAQLVLMILFAKFVVFPVMGKDYDAAVMTAGFCG